MKPGLERFFIYAFLQDLRLQSRYLELWLRVDSGVEVDVDRMEYWFTTAGPWVVERIFGFGVYSALFPCMLRHFHFSTSFVVLTLLQFTTSLLFLNWYDRRGVDIFSIEVAREKIRTMWRWTRRGNKRSFFGKTLRFLFFFWQFFPGVGILFLRPGGNKGSRQQELLMLAGASNIFTLYWLCVWSGIFSLPDVIRFFRHMFAFLIG